MAIGTLNEKPLHAALKEWYARPDDRFEVAVQDAGRMHTAQQAQRFTEIRTIHAARLVQRHTGQPRALQPMPVPADQHGHLRYAPQSGQRACFTCCESARQPP